MSFRAEVASFLDGATKVNDMIGKNKDRATKEKYYDALISNQKTTADFHNRQLASNEKLARERLGVQRDQLGQNAAFRRDQLGVQRDRIGMMKDYYNSRPGGRAAPGAVDTGAGETSRLFNGQGGTGAVGGVPYTNGPGAGSIPPGGAGDSSDDGDVEYGDDAAPQQLPMDEEEDFASGGVVGKSAVDDSDQEPTVQSVNARREQSSAAPTGPATATKTTGGFDLAKTLSSWQEPPPKYDTPLEQQSYNGNDMLASKPKVQTEQGLPEPAPKYEGALDIGEPKKPKPTSGVDTGAAPLPTNANPEAGMNPVALGAQGLIDTYKLGKTGIDVDGKQKGLGTHEGAYTDHEIKAINQAVDPHGELSESARVIARLDSAVKYHLARGDQKKAAEMAKSLLSYGGLQASKFGAAAAKAIQAGKMDEAAKYVALGLDQVPDGRSIGVAADKNGAFHATATDPQTGEVSDLGNFDTGQVMKLALGLQSGSEYYNRLGQIAGGNFGRVTSQGNARTKVPAEQGEKVPLLANRERATNMIEKVSDQFKPAEGADPKHFEEAKGLAAQLLHNNNIDPKNAMRLVDALTDISGEPKVKVLKRDDSGGALVEWNGQRLKLSNNTIAQIGMLRKSQEDAKATTDKKATERKALEDRQKEIRARQPTAAPGRAPSIRDKPLM